MQLSRHALLPAAVASVAALASSACGDLVQESWIERLDGPASMNDYGNDVAVAPDGSVYVAGLVFEQVSSSLFAPRFATIRYDAAGARLWTRTYQGTFASGAASAEHVAVDADGNVIVSGSTNQGYDWAILKYDPSGTELWRRVYEADSTFLTEPDDMVLDAVGNAYLVGYVGDPINPAFGAVVKVAPDGTIAWAKKYYGPLFDGATFASVAVDAEGNVYAGGAAVISGLAGEMAIVKYDANGTQQWLATHGSLGGFSHDRVDRIAVDGNGDVIVAGALANVDIGLVKLDSAGEKLWATSYAGPAGGSDSVSALAVDHANDIVVAGSSYAAPNDHDALTLKYGGDGTLQWERRVAGDEIHVDYATAVEIDTQNNVYVAGTYDPIGGSRFFTTRYEPDGTQLWLMDFAGPLGGGSPGALALGPDQSVCVTGESPDLGTDFDITTIRYEQTTDGVPGDITGDGSVAFDDLLALLAAWGPCAECAACAADLDGTCSVDFADLLVLLSSWS